MPKIIILEATQVDYGDDRGGQHAESGSIVDVVKDQARRLAEIGRALYTTKGDDPSKDGRYTATKELLATARAMADARSKNVVNG
jgi:hypothetical protein